MKVHDSLAEEKLEETAIHLPGTGFPWQAGANTYIAGHRLGYFGTGSFLVFSRLNELDPGDEIIVEDSAGQEYVYRRPLGNETHPRKEKFSQRREA